ncbi:MBL fold metallo-hydrolase [Acidovorax sp. sic0104]|uniref:MBL fold metallo-hydrolase n=1 Tax=Acidovorax sp. sic0104 TaxID=2854784 RepID=UPI001C46D27C|nr:MBL fold metallo-hydrolase [Acidovorax sp. sic0104]MBV7544250.1 MBL fold metallo-hydrolase [Acidovorax sp. sic0104]
MHITHLRNATVLLEFSTGGPPVGLLVDPMLARRGSLPALRYLGAGRQRNPIVDLPPGTDDALERVTHALITHCQRGHFDHLDRAGLRFLRERQIPVICMPRDADYLAQRGLVVLPLSGPTGQGRQPFTLGGHVTPIPCVHGTGWIARFMEHGHGYLLELPGEPSVYLAGDTLLTPAVRDCLARLRPDVAVLPAGGARFDVGAEILMDAADMAEAAALAPGTLVVNHLQALDHCPTTREAVRALAQQGGWAHRLWVPEDGESRPFHLMGMPVAI